MSAKVTPVTHFYAHCEECLWIVSMLSEAAAEIASQRHDRNLHSTCWQDAALAMSTPSTPSSDVPSPQGPGEGVTSVSGGR